MLYTIGYSIQILVAKLKDTVILKPETYFCDHKVSTLALDRPGHYEPYL